MTNDVRNTQVRPTWAKRNASEAIFWLYATTLHLLYITKCILSSALQMYNLRPMETK